MSKFAEEKCLPVQSDEPPMPCLRKNQGRIFGMIAVFLQSSVLIVQQHESLSPPVPNTVQLLLYVGVLGWVEQNLGVTCAQLYVRGIHRAIQLFSYHKLLPET